MFPPTRVFEPKCERFYNLPAELDGTVKRLTRPTKVHGDAFRWQGEFGSVTDDYTPPSTSGLQDSRELGE